MNEIHFIAGCVPTEESVLQAALAQKVGARLTTLPPPPPVYDGTFGVQDWDIYYNNVDGTCVSAELFNFKKIITKGTGAPELDIPDKAMYDWARRHGYLNGANINEALGVLRRDGVLDAAGVEHKGGKHAAIDFRNRDEVMYAIQYLRGLNIGANHVAMNSASNGSGVITGVTRRGAITHSVGVYAYGSMDYCARVALRTLPASVKPDDFGVVIYTWKQLLVCDWPSFTTITGEAWARIDDPDRGDRAEWDAVAEKTFAEIVSA